MIKRLLRKMEESSNVSLPVRKYTADQVRQVDLFIINLLRRGYRPASVIDRVVSVFGYAESTARNKVYALNSQLRKSNSELLSDAKDYIVTTLVGAIEDCNELSERVTADAIRVKLGAIKQLSDVCKLSDSGRSDVTIHFDFGDE